MSRLEGIQVLRGVAALLVALFHFHAIEGLYGPDQLTPVMFELGRAGVDMFFVISGAIMMHVAGATPPARSTATSFLLKRAARIYPPYWVVTAGLVAVWLLSGQTVFNGLVGEAPDFAASFALWPTTREPILGVGWTLIHELYFYLVFALLLLFPVRLRLPLMALWAAVVIAAWFAGSASFAPPLALATSPLTLEFILGACAMALARHARPVHCQLALVLAVVWLAAALTLTPPETDGILFADPMRRTLSFGPPAALVLLSIAAQPGPWPRAGVTLGDWSYALYLVHVPVYAVLGAIWAHFAVPGLADNIAALILFPLIAIAVSAVFYRAVERPAFALTQRLLKPRSAATV